MLSCLKLTLFVFFLIHLVYSVPLNDSSPEFELSPSPSVASLSTELLITVEEHQSFGSSLATTSSLSACIKNHARAIDSLSILPNSAQASQRASTVCSIASIIYPSHTILSKNGSFYTFEQDYNWSETCWLPAACFIMIQDALHVATALKVVRYLGSKFAIRSGGHNPNSGFGSVNVTGVLFDLRNLKSIALDSDGILQTGPGNTWGELYNFLEPHNVSVQGGRHSTVGVGGYLLGGGMTFFPNLLGLGVDSICNVEVVLANSSIINANPTTHREIFRALKGGGPNLGIVTRFDIRTHPLHRIWYSLQLFAAADYKAVLNATVQVQNAMESDPKLGFFLNVNPGIIIAGLLYADWTSMASGFAAFRALKSVGVFLPETNGTISTLIGSLNIGSSSARREPFAVSHAVDFNLYVDIHERYLQLLNTSYMPSANLSYTIQPMGRAGVLAGHQNGGNTLGLTPTPQTWHASLVEWLDKSDDEAAHGAVNRLGNGARSLADAHDGLFDLQFMNDASFTQQPLKSYGPESVAQIATTIQSYDPDGVFQKLQNSGFLLSHEK